MENKQTAIILVGGLGKRLLPLTKITPKPLLKIGQDTILEIIINHLIKNKFKKIIFAARYKSKSIKDEIKKLKKKYNKVEFIINIEKKKLGTCGPIKLCRNHLPENFLVINGDILTNVNLKNIFNRFLRKKMNFLVFVKKVYSPFEFGRLDIKNKKITAVEEKPIFKNFIVGGIYILNKKCISLIPENKYFGMDQLIKLFLKNKLTINTHVMSNDLWIDVGNHKTYKNVNKMKNTLFNKSSKK
jgi:NDP-sugar pyrophosphorylase family protein